MSSLASLLSYLVSGREKTISEDSGESTVLQAQTHAEIRSAASERAKKKARILFKHRSAIVRWTAAAAEEEEVPSGDGESRIPECPSSSSVSDATALIIKQQRREVSNDEGAYQDDFVRGDVLSLVETEELGRRLVAAASIAPGTVLLQERPFAWCVERHFATEYCAHCMGELPRPPIRCFDCNQVAYCSPACSSNARETWHGDECLDDAGHPIELALSGLSSTCRTALRAVRRSKRTSSESDADNIREPSSPSNAVYQVSTNGFVVSHLRCAGPAVGPLNTLSHGRIGNGLYCSAAMLNHSCRPNAVARFNGGQMCILSSRRIDEREDVTISYGPLSSKVQSISERRRLLQKGYFFRCECEMCNDHHGALKKTRKEGSRIDYQGMQATAVISSELVCTVKDCPGELVVRWPPASASNFAVTLSAPPQKRVSCDRCGSDVAQHTFGMLSKEVDEDGRRWGKALALVRHSENASKTSTDRLRSCEDPQSAQIRANAVALVALCTRWRDNRLVTTSMKRAEAHDLMTRLLFLGDDFPGAARHCRLAVAVLERRFFPEDLELGLEFSKLAHMCCKAGMWTQCVDACQQARVSMRVCLPEGDEKLVELDMIEDFCRIQSSTQEKYSAV